jgi:uncharacterized SAM-binding protein YcdF (DUF218 family)
VVELHPGRLLEGEGDAATAVRFFAAFGIPQERLILENESRNTYESAVNVPRLLKQEPPGEYLLITSAFHLRRSVACFRKAGFKVDVFSTDFYTHPRYFSPDILFIPSPDSIMTWQKLFKEWAGMVAYKVAGYI